MTEKSSTESSTKKKKGSEKSRSESSNKKQEAEKGQAMSKEKKAMGKAGKIKEKSEAARQKDILIRYAVFLLFPIHFLYKISILAVIRFF